MSNPFKPGDKLVVLPSLCSCYTPGQVVTVAQRRAPRHENVICEEAYFDGELPENGISCCHFRAAIAGVDYPLPSTGPIDATYAGHLADGSSVQKHSAGPLYPCVLVWRDKKGGPNEDGKYDVGVITPKNAEPLWFSTFDKAMSVAEAIKGAL